jgi:hypothetical protein
VSVVIELAFLCNLGDVFLAHSQVRRRFLHARPESQVGHASDAIAVSTTNLEQVMLSEDTYRLPILSAVGHAARQRLAGLGRALSNFLRHLFSGGHPRVPELPDDLRADLGLEAPPHERVDAFWDYRRNSASRDLPF